MYILSVCQILCSSMAKWIKLAKLLMWDKKYF